MTFQSLDKKDFLKKYWQKKPLVIRGGFEYLREVLEPDELAGLSCEEGVEARLILEKDGKSPWELRHRPFDEQIFSQLPEENWTLLVQGVEQWVPEVYELLDQFRFIPNWRIDDVMVSYAPNQGTVGPHLDQYDVFLVQGWGRREWRVSKEPITEEDLIPNLDLKILKEFSDYETYVLEEGDILYLPPNYGHHGIAMGQSMTYSVGFRAPHDKEIVGHYSDHVLIHRPDSQVYGDPTLALQSSSGLMDQEVIDKLYARALKTLAEPVLFQEFLGKYMTYPKYDLQPEPSTVKPWRDLNDTSALEKFLGVRLVYQLGESLRFYVNGNIKRLEPEILPLVKYLCDSPARISWGELKSISESCNGQILVEELFSEGWLIEAE